jgi:hypothetical protein
MTTNIDLFRRLKKLERTKIMDKKHWKFKAAASEFDGSRVTREARAAGLNFVTLNRVGVYGTKGGSITLATREFVELLKVHNLYKSADFVALYHTLGAEFWLSDKLELSTRPSKMPLMSTYFFRYLGSANSAHELAIQLSLKIDREPTEYTVTGWWGRVAGYIMESE